MGNKLDKYKSGGWIQKAVNPKHKGYCTPMTKSTCTPHRKALAMTFKKHHGFHEDGGEVKKYGYGGDVETADALKGAVSGATSGSVFGPWGTAIGGLVGGVGGYFQGKSQADLYNNQPNQSQMASQLAMPYGYTSKFEDGGNVDKALINVERNELEVANGRVVRDFKNKPPHPKDGSIDTDGNVKAGVGNIIIPADQRDDYVKGSPFKRRTIEMQLRSQPSSKKAGDGTLVEGNFPKEKVNYLDNITPDELVDNIGDVSKQLNSGDTTTPSNGYGFANIAQKAAPYLDNAVNAYLTTRTPNIPKPVLQPHINLKKTINIDPALTDITRNQRSVTGGIANNTSSGAIYRNSVQDLFAKSQALRDNLFADKETTETGLYNQEQATNSGIDARNVGLQNATNQQKMQRQADINNQWSRNAANATSDIQGQIKDANMAKANIQNNTTLEDMSVMDLASKVYNMDPGARSRFMQWVAAYAPDKYRQLMLKMGQ